MAAKDVMNSSLNHKLITEYLRKKHISDFRKVDVNAYQYEKNGTLHEAVIFTGEYLHCYENSPYNWNISETSERGLLIADREVTA